MTEQVQIEFIAGPSTPLEFAHKVGTKTFPLDPGRFIPAPGSQGQLLGVPGIMREGWKWEIADVDLRDPVTKLLDEADALNTPPVAGERIDEVLARQARTQHLLLKAQSAMLRRTR
jgi:hypothetical protein